MNVFIPNRRKPSGVLATAGVILLAASNCCCAQLPTIARTDSAPGSSTLPNRLGNADTDPMNQNSLGHEPGIPAPQLLQILQDNPEAMDEVKSLIADQAQQQGLSDQADMLTDQEVFKQIESNRELRVNVTEFLRARGYVTDEDIQAATDDTMPDSLPARGYAVNQEDMDLESPRSLATVGTGRNRGDDESSTPDVKRSPRGQSEVQSDAGPTHAPNVTDAPRALRRPAPYTLLSLRNLYTQAPSFSGKLSRFGSGLFVTHDDPSAHAFGPEHAGLNGAMDVPLGPDYVLGPGDELSIHIWGGVSLNLLRLVDREGRIALPEGGLIQVAGLTMASAQTLISNTLQGQYRNVQVSMTVSRLRSIRIFVVGDVMRPGAYEVSALASPISPLFLAGGPTASGSMRILRHYRNDKLVGEVDLYDFMLHGVRPTDDRLQNGDTLLVPPVGAQVAIMGAVKRPAIYELKDEKDLAEVLSDAGGVTVAAALTHIVIDRVVENQGREEIAVNAGDEDPDPPPDLKAVAIRDGDRVRVATVLPSEQRVIYLEGHVARPGTVPFRDNLRINDVIRSYQDLLPEPAERGEIVRLVLPDLHPETIDFDVPDVLHGHSTLVLQPFDTIRIFGRYEEADAPTVTIRGEVESPGKYPLFEGMTAAQLVRAAGGFKRDAFLARADLASYGLIDGDRVSVQRKDIAIGDAVLKGDRDANTPLKAGDVLTIHQVAGWKDIGASIMIEGEVAHPGSYGFQEGEHLSDLLKRAGGFRPEAYPEGAVLTRPEVASLEEKNRQELIRQVETASAAARLPTAVRGEQSASLQLVELQQNQLLSQLRSQPATGRLVIHINSAIDSWAGSAADIAVRSGDVLRIPKRPDFVLVSGQVYNPSAITYMPHKSAGWYLQHAGGVSPSANSKEIFVIRANGDVIGRRSGGLFERDLLSTKLNPGDAIVVPQKIIGAPFTLRNLLGTAQIAASIAITAAVAGL